MINLTEGKSYLINFTKADGTKRTMVGKVEELLFTFHGNQPYAKVEEVLPSGEKQMRTVILERILSVNPVKQRVPAVLTSVGAFTATSTTQHTSGQENAATSFRTALNALCSLKEKYEGVESKSAPKYTIKKQGLTFDVSLEGKSLGKCYSVKQVERLIDFHKSYKLGK